MDLPGRLRQRPLRRPPAAAAAAPQPLVNILPGHGSGLAFFYEKGTPRAPPGRCPTPPRARHRLPCRRGWSWSTPGWRRRCPRHGRSPVATRSSTPCAARHARQHAQPAPARPATVRWRWRGSFRLRPGQLSLPLAILVQWSRRGSGMILPQVCLRKPSHVKSCINGFVEA